MDPSESKDDHYLTTLKIFRQKSGVRTAIMNLAEEVAAHVLKNMRKDRKEMNNREPPEFRALGVGSGHGQTDLRILSAVAKAVGSPRKTKPAIHVTVIEPSTQIQEFQASVLSVPQPLSDLAEISFEWHNTTLEQFIGISPKLERFDLVHFVASLYYMDADKALTECYQRLSSGGAIFCTIGPEESFYPKLSRKLYGKVDLGSIHKFYTEVDIINIAKKNDWKYEELWRTHYTVDITSCFDESSQEGGFILDFLTHRQEFRNTADKELYKEIMDFLNEESTTKENGNKVVKPEITAVVIYK